MNTPQNKPQTTFTGPNSFREFVPFFFKKLAPYAIFWCWNFIFLVLLIYTEVETGMLHITIKNGLTGYTPVDFTLYALLVFAIPLVTIVLGFTLLRKKPEKLMRLFYGVEIPLSLLFILRLVLFRDLTPSATHIFIMIAFGMLSFLAHILLEDRYSDKYWYQVVVKAGNATLIIIGIYISLILVIYCMPMLYEGLIGFVTFRWLEVFELGFWVFLFLIFFVITGTLFLLLPVALPWLYIRSFIRNYRIKIQYGTLITFGTLTTNLFLLFALNYAQPQTSAFEQLDLDFSSPVNREKFIRNQSSIKRGLINAYLCDYRYLGSAESANSIKNLYETTFDLKEENAQGVQNVYNFLFRPFLYQGDLNEDPEKAKMLYEKFFDGNIQKNETNQIVNALKATWDSDGIEAGILNVNQEKVHIVKQEVTITEQDDIAEIELYEVYNNKTFSRQEIFYYFTLPDNAVITGMWLSDEDEIKKKYAFNVSPRGAAQQVYKNQVRQQVDPSLLEQVGPGRYRLRAFPIEPKIRKTEYHNSRYDYEVEEGKNFHLWLRYKTMVSNENSWKLPRLLERRNVYWSTDTELLVNGTEVSRGDSWWPESIQCSKATQRKSHSAALNDSLILQMNPVQISPELRLETMRLTLLIDGSYSMNAQKRALLSTLEQLKINGFDLPNSTVYVVNDYIALFGGEEFNTSLRNQKGLFFGSTNTKNMLHRFYQIEDKPTADLVLLLTDKGNYEAIDDSLNAIAMDVPLYLMHISDEQTPVYADALLETIQNSQGKIVNDPNDLIRHLYLKSQADPKFLTYQDGWAYSIANPTTHEPVPSPDATGAVQASKYIESLRIPNDSTRNHFLDQVHEIAMREQIVTEFSSMIVLVNDAQKEALKRAEEANDRFDREVENGEENLTKPNNPHLFNVSGTPEPHEWILIFLITGFILYHLYTKGWFAKLRALTMRNR